MKQRQRRTSVMGETLLQEKTVVAIISGMAKTEQVRVRTELTGKARHAAMALYGESLPDYVDRVLSEALARDFPAAVKILSEQVEGTARDNKPRRKA